MTALKGAVGVIRSLGASFRQGRCRDFFGIDIGINTLWIVAARSSKIDERVLMLRSENDYECSEFQG